MKKNNQKIKIILVSVIVLNLILIGFYFFVFSAIKKKSEGTSSAYISLNEYLSKEGKINILKSAIKKTTTDRVNLEKYFINIDDIPVFTKKIESLSSVAGVDSIVINSLSKKDNVLLLNFEAKGKFENIIYLEQLVENLPFRVNVNKLYVSKIANVVKGQSITNWEGLYSVEIIGFFDN